MFDVEKIEKEYVLVDEGKLEELLFNYKKESTPSIFRRAQLLLKKYSLSGEEVYYRRAMNEMEDVLSIKENSVFSSLLSAMDQAVMRKELASMLTTLSIAESLQSFSTPFLDEWSGKYIYYLFNRMKGNNGIALSYLREASSINPSLEKELADFTLLFSYFGASNIVYLDDSLNVTKVEKQVLERLLPPVIPEKKVIVLPEKALLFAVEDFVEFCFAFYSIDKDFSIIKKQLYPIH